MSVGAQAAVAAYANFSVDRVGGENLDLCAGLFKSGNHCAEMRGGTIGHDQVAAGNGLPATRNVPASMRSGMMR